MVRLSRKTYNIVQNTIYKDPFFIILIILRQEATNVIMERQAATSGTYFKY